MGFRRIFQAIVCLFLAACGPSPTATVAPSPEDLPPLPPQQDTSIGLLLEHSQELGLSGAQLAHFESLERELEVKNEAIDEELREHEERRAAREKAGKNGNSGRSGGGMRGGGGRPGGGMRGGSPAGGGGMRGGGRPRGSGANPPNAGDGDQGKHHEHVQSLHSQKAANNSDTLEAAWLDLEPEQKTKARAILEEEGHEVRVAQEIDAPAP